MGRNRLFKRASHRSHRAPWREVLVVVGVMLVLAAGQGIVITTHMGEDAGPPSESSSTIDTRPACRVLVAGAELVVAEARRAMDDLAPLLGAYEAWGEGRISDRRMAAVSEASQEVGPDEVRSYVDAQTRYSNVETDACAGQSEECVTRVEALKASLQVAQEGMDLWDQHLTHMADLAADGSAALARWDRTRTEADTVLSAWEQTEQALAQAPGCGS